MISTNQIKLIQTLTRKKKREEHGLFVAEGDKTILDLLPFFETKFLFSVDGAIPNAEIITDREMKKATHLSTPSSSLAVFYKKESSFDLSKINGELSLVLDDIQDPGNLGTIIRIADWFGIRNIFCSKSTVDVYNSKTVKSTMGAMSRVNVHYVDLMTVLSELTCPIYGTFMDGENIYESDLPKSGIIVMGNEGNGISDDLLPHISHRLTIPSFGDKSSESLNVAIATGIVCSEFRRN